PIVRRQSAVRRRQARCAGEQSSATSMSKRSLVISLLELLLHGRELGFRLGERLTVDAGRWKETALLSAGPVERPRDAAEFGARRVAAGDQPTLERGETLGVRPDGGRAARTKVGRAVLHLNLKR